MLYHINMLQGMQCVVSVQNRVAAQVTIDSCFCVLPKMLAIQSVDDGMIAYA